MHLARLQLAVVWAGMPEVGMGVGKGALRDPNERSTLKFVEPA